MNGMKIIYWIATGILSALMLFSAGMYLFNTAFVAEAYTALGYPTYLIYPLAFAKILGVVTILFVKNRVLREWAYAGFFFVALLGLLSHIAVGDGQFGGALVALIAVVVSYTTRKKLARKR